MMSPIDILQGAFEASLSSHCVAPWMSEIEKPAGRRTSVESQLAISARLSHLMLPHDGSWYYFTLILIKSIQRLSFQVLRLKQYRKWGLPELKQELIELCHYRPVVGQLSTSRPAEYIRCLAYQHQPLSYKTIDCRSQQAEMVFQWPHQQGPLHLADARLAEIGHCFAKRHPHTLPD